MSASTTKMRHSIGAGASDLGGRAARSKSQEAAVTTMIVSVSFVFALSFVPTVIHGWASLDLLSYTRNRLSLTKRKPSFVAGRRAHTTSSSASPLNSIDPSSSILLAEESWRQYVPLAVSAIVIVDILLGSPLLNLVVAPMKRQAEKGGDDDADNRLSSIAAQPRVNPKERVDSEKVAQEALDRARNSLELREFLEAQKTDWDRMEEIRKKMDKQMADLDETLAEKSRQGDKA